MQLHMSLQPFDSKCFSALMAYYATYDSEVHDLNLTNLLIWHKKHNLHFLETNGFVIYVYHPENPFLCTFSEPVGNHLDKSAMISALSHLFEICKNAAIRPSFRHVSERFKVFIENTPYTFEAFEREDDFDYIYLSEELAHLSGNRFHKKKNHLNQFLKNYALISKSEHITVHNAMDALSVAQNWCHENGCEGSNDLCFEFQGIKALMQNWDMQLSRGVRGQIIYVAEQPVALTIGEPLNSDTYLIHIEKAQSNYVGIYATINHAMANIAWPKYTFINREQDMGIEGIKKAKLSYHPHHMVKKYDLYMNKGPL